MRDFQDARPTLTEGTVLKHLLAVWVALALLQSSCAAILAPKTTDVPINTQPQQAEVIIDGVARGMTPMHLELANNRTYVIVLRKAGYPDMVYELRNSVGAGWIVADVLLTGLIGVAIDAGTGAWYSLDEMPIVIPLLPPPRGAVPVAGEPGTVPPAPRPPPCDVTGTEQWKHASAVEKRKLLEQCRQQPPPPLAPEATPAPLPPPAPGAEQAPVPGPDQAPAPGPAQAPAPVPTPAP